MEVCDNGKEITGCLGNSTYEDGFILLKILKRVDETLDKTFDSGDREIRTWYLVRQNILPFVLCGMYALFVTLVGPAFMRNRKPWTLRWPMIVFNFGLVLTYTVALLTILTQLPYLGVDNFCKGTKVTKGGLAYTLTGWCWVIYILKYVEFIDTLFFVLRKKNEMITYLHVVHHTTVPIVGWILMRTETSGFQTIPVLVNAFVHIIMYSYYGLAAIGPHMRKYLWWKKYLTIMQMVQFISFLLFVGIVAPLSGCSIVPTSLWLDTVGGVVFLVLFYNFYRNTFNSHKVKGLNGKGDESCCRAVMNGNVNNNDLNGKMKDD